MEGYARRIAVAGIKAVPRMQQHMPSPNNNPPAAPHSAAGGNPTASNLYPDPGRPYSPSSYTTLPAQMVYFTFP